MGGQWIDQLSGGGTTGLNATKTLQEATKKTSECSPAGDSTEVSTENSGYCEKERSFGKYTYL